METAIQSVQPDQPATELAEFEAVATRLEQRLNKFGITEQALLAAAAQVRARMLAEVYGLEVEALAQP